MKDVLRKRSYEKPRSSQNYGYVVDVRNKIDKYCFKIDDEIDKNNVCKVDKDTKRDVKSPIKSTLKLEEFCKVNSAIDKP